MKGTNKNLESQKGVRLPIYLTQFGFFPMNANGKVSNVNCPINQEPKDIKLPEENLKKMRNVFFDF